MRKNNVMLTPLIAADRLILMGDWRDSFAAMNEETGAIY
jgi:hypothetical protein